MFCSRFVHHHHCHHRPSSVVTRNPTKNWSQEDLLPSNQTRYIFVSSLSISISPLSQSKSSKTKIIIRGQLANNRPKRNWCHDGHPPLCWIWSWGHFFETVLLSNKKDAKREICFCFSLNQFQSVGLFLLLDSNFVRKLQYFLFFSATAAYFCMQWVLSNQLQARHGHCDKFIRHNAAEGDLGFSHRSFSLLWHFSLNCQFSLHCVSHLISHFVNLHVHHPHHHLSINVTNNQVSSPQCQSPCLSLTTRNVEI